MVHIPRAQTMHEATYMCRVTNDAGISEKEFKLDVLGNGFLISSSFIR